MLTHREDGPICLHWLDDGDPASAVRVRCRFATTARIGDPA